MGMTIDTPAQRSAKSRIARKEAAVGGILERGFPPIPRYAGLEGHQFPKHIPPSPLRHPGIARRQVDARNLEVHGLGVGGLVEGREQAGGLGAVAGAQRVLLSGGGVMGVIQPPFPAVCPVAAFHLPPPS